jgi:Tfp pilus assembly protein PilF
MKKLSIILIILMVTISCASNKNAKTSDERKANLYYTQGTQNLLDAQYTNALKNLLEAYKYRPNDTKILNNLGMAYYYKKSVGNAKRFLNEALELDPKNSDARMNLANIHMEQADYTSAETQYKKILQDLLFPKQFQTYHNLAKLEQKRRNTLATKKYLAQSIEANENYCPAYFDLGTIQMEEGQFAKAEQNFKEASMGLCYKKPEPRFLRAKALVQMNQYFEATQILEEMTETFAMTKWEQIARRGIDKIKKAHDKKVLNTLEAKNTKKTILSPDF